MSGGVVLGRDVADGKQECRGMWGSDFMPHDCSVVRMGCRSTGRNRRKVFGEGVKVLDGNGVMVKEGNTTTSMRVLVGGTRMINGRVK